MTDSTKSATTQAGLTVERLYTTPGVHPYDEVTWERRDVVQTNWRTGDTVFEQRGVEFPDFWSVNASTIVTSKYFRGAVGSVERESSLRQLVDRVVLTYVKAGRDNGYFATPDDAEVFEHELTWMLLHQVFSFNSPVWFNVGTSSPQQVSACQPYHALVSTPDGLVPIGKLVEDNAVGAKVYDAHGLTRVLAVKANGVKDVLRLHPKAGYPLDVTSDHLVWSADDEFRGRFVAAGSLRPGDLLLHVDPEVGGRDRRTLEIAWVEQIGAMEVYDIQTESGEYLSGNLRVHNCFILAVDDNMDSILNWYREEGLIFKGGSGSGLNISKIRSAKELLRSSGGTASGPVSFMRGADASAGTIKSGGATRRAAKMVVLDVDHPDIAEFVATKAREEDKIRVLRDAGFDMDLGGHDISSVQYQNANNSVRVTDEFMRAVEEGSEFALRGRLTGEVIETVDAKQLWGDIAQAAWECADPGVQYDGTINDWHTTPESGRITASNPCSEYMHLDNSSCNLASLNLMKFLTDDGSFDAVRFAKAVELVITAMDISICFADFPTEAIGETTRSYRQLGIGYANLGALLMASGLAYDSEGGRALAASITSLMTGAAYKRSAELAGVVGPYDGYARNATPHTRVMRKHQAANDAVRTVHPMDSEVHAAATKAWADGLAIGAENGWRNAQASVIAPTGCLTGDTMVTTDRGLSRLSELGDVWGDRWQDLDAKVSTDEGPRQATKFFVNGEEPTRRIVTKGGYRIQGTLAHRVKVVDPASGEWAWKRMADITEGDVVPMQLGTLVGEPRRVPLPVLDQAYYGGDHTIEVPDIVTPELAELVGYFMGDGSLHAKGIRLCVADTDLDVVERLRVLAKELFGLEPRVRQQQGYQEVTLQSIRLARWWKAAGFTKVLPGADHVGKGWKPRIPSALLETNDASIYSAFVRGLFEADGTVLEKVPSFSTACESFAAEVRTLLLALGLATTTRDTASGWGGPSYQVRLRNIDYALVYEERIGFMGVRKNELLPYLESPQAGNRDRIHLSREVWDEVAPKGSTWRNAVNCALGRGQGVSRQTTRLINAERRDPRLIHALGYLYEQVASNEDGGVQPTYDLSVPDNVTYVAGGFVSHNTIAFMLDADTTGIEPDFSLVKFKKLVGGGSMQIVNQTVPRALTKLGYQDEQIEAIVEYIAEHGHVIDAPGLRPEHYEVFDCAMGERAIKPMGHIRMMAAAQPFLSGAISKTVNMPESATVNDIAEMYFQGWKLGLKAIAVYRDNCKVGQPLSDGRGKHKEVPAQESAPAELARPVRTRLPKSRPSLTTSFTVGGAEGYMTAGSYPDDGLGEVFLKLGKQGSTLAGVMDAFSMAISISLQYGVPLETYVQKFTNMKFEPAGLTDDPDVRMSQSIMDYIFRRLALDHLPFERRAALGIYTAEERQRQLETGSYE
ncbi:MAG: adenosylcobalamin-dependent ribonucleoside-diphosphate reductase, partial [Actinomycetota bacterium]|nr:adenosylcobalamin-dependent ribonucleoside-diphosphate reductase [Actinomycetota bacterium]